MSQIQIKFTKIHEKYGIYKDALYIDEDLYYTLSEQQIEDMKLARFNNWVYIIEHPIENIESINLEEI